MTDAGGARLISRRAAMKALGLAAGTVAAGVPARMAEASHHSNDPDLQVVLDRAKSDFKRIQGRDMTPDEQIKYRDIAARTYSFFLQGVTDGGKTVTPGLLPSLYKHANGNATCQANGLSAEHNTGIRLICNLSQLDAAGIGKSDVELALCAYRVGRCAADEATGPKVTPNDYAVAWKSFREGTCAVHARAGVSLIGLGC